MTYSTYAELKSSVLAYAHRTDLDGVIDDIFARAEAGLNRELRTIQQEARTTLTTTQGSISVSLPSGFLEAIDVRLDDGSGFKGRITPFPQHVINEPISTSETGIPEHYRIGNQVIEFDVPCAGAYTVYLHYYQKWDLATDDTNWLLSYYPDLYANATLTEVGVYTRDPDMITAGKALVMDAIEKIKLENYRVAANQLCEIDLALRGGGGFNINRGY